MNVSEIKQVDRLKCEILNKKLMKSENFVKKKT